MQSIFMLLMLFAPGMRNSWKSRDARKVSAGLIDTLVAHAPRIPDPQTELAFTQLGEGITMVSKDATVYTHRDGTFVMNVHGRWDNPANDIECMA